MSDDPELLELAAKAAGMEWRWDIPRGHKGDGFFRACVPGAGPVVPLWNPLTDDGVAFRLAVKLNLRVESVPGWSVCYAGTVTAKQFSERHGFDPYAATRRAIVRAAAEIGRRMP